MKRMRKNLTHPIMSVFLILTLLILSFPIVQAKNYGNETSFNTIKDDLEPVIPSDTSTIDEFLDSDDNLKENFEQIFNKIINPIKRSNPEKISIDSSEISLYITFENQELAMENIKKTVPNYIKYLKDTHHLDELSDSTFSQYVRYANTAAYVTPESNIFDTFVDIYENVECNREIKNLVLTSKDHHEEDFLNKISTMVPNTNKEFIDHALGSLAKEKTATEKAFVFNVANAKAYATKYAKPSDPAAAAASQGYEYREDADCTNFASQIRVAGGVKEDVIWYHYWSLPGGYSEIWYNANAFVNNLGTFNTTKGLYQLSKDLYPGSYISFDRANDGSWEHVGFIVDKESTLNNRGFYHFRVAQHSDNYDRWTTVDGNGWPREVNGTCLFGIMHPY